jgi:hypothetical protein
MDATHAYGIHLARRDVALEALPVDPAIEASHQRRGIEHTREPDAGQPQRMANQSQQHARTTAADDGRDHIPLAQPLPQRHGLFGLLALWKMGKRGKRYRVDRTDAGPAPDRHALAARL